jgi:ATP-dependent Clp protease ATP-binding subunit ClpA
MDIDPMFGYVSDDDFVVPDKLKKRIYNTRESSRKRQAAKTSDAISLIHKELALSIVAREEEAKTIASLVDQPLGGVRLILLGARGIGKRSTIIKTADLIKQRALYQVDCQALACDLDFDKCIESEIAPVYQKDPDAILYFRDFDALFDIQECRNYFFTLFCKNTSLIVSLSDEKQETLDMLHKYHFRSVLLQDYTAETATKIVEKILVENKMERVNFSRQAIELGVRLSSKYETGAPLVIRSLHLMYETANRQKVPGLDLQVDKRAVACLMHQKTGVAVEDLLNSSQFSAERFVQKLKESIVGQDGAILSIAQTVAMFKRGLLDPAKPWGSFLFAGPTGVGKTELSLMLAKEVYNKKEAFIRFAGSDFNESWHLSTLVGSPKGYEGNTEGGILAETLIHNPYLVILFDEFEKAHDGVRKLFMEILGAGRFQDHKGRVIDCTKALFVMATNIGQQTLLKGGRNVDDQVKKELCEILSPELVNRFSNIVLFRPLSSDQLEEVASIHLKKLQKRFRESAKIDLEWKESLTGFLAKTPYDHKLGMRDFCRNIESMVTLALAKLPGDFQGKAPLDFDRNQIVIV